MIDYDLPMIDQDKNELFKLEFLFVDNEKNDIVNYIEIFKEMGPKKKITSIAELTSSVVRIQALVRGMLDRKYAADLKMKGAGMIAS